MNEESKKEYGTLVAKKSERLVMALYLVTDLMSERDPIKYSLRKNSVSLISSMNALSQHDVKDRITEFKLSLKAVTEIMSLLHVAVTTGIVSEMNGSLLMDGFRALQLVLEKKQPILTKEMLTIDNEGSLTQEKGFSSAITTTSYDALTPLSLARLQGNNHEFPKLEDENKIERFADHLNLGKSDVKKQKVKKSNFNRGVDIKDRKQIKNSFVGSSSHPLSSLASSFQMRKNSRREQILSLFVKGVDVSIKDIVSRIRGCSEKTIQRELNSLLYDEIIERIGEKRWSRYVLR